MAAPPTVTVRSPQPVPPERQFSFTDFQTNNPSAPLPADRLDGEIDRTNEAIEDTIAWASTSLNSDGSLKPQTITKAQLAPGIFEGVVEAELTELRPMIADARAAAEAAISLANEADASALTAGNRANLALDASERASTEAEDAANSAAEAAQSALEAAASATAASDHANHALGSENLAEDWSWVSVEWAEHMPDTIPPNILATNGITGEHWSSRWWAHRAGEIVIEGQQEIVCAIEAYWLGAHPTPPALDSCGKPIAPGAMYFDTSEGVTKVYDGANWHDVVQPVPGNIDEYLYLPASPTTVFTGTDARGNPLVLDPGAAEVGVYLNGVKLLEGYDYSLSANTVTFTQGAVTAPNTVEMIVVGRTPTPAPMPNGTKVNTAPWVFDGTTKTFPLADANGNTITPPSAHDCIVSLNGVIQEGGADYQTRAGFIDFTVAPEADADRWMVVGLGGVGGPGAGGQAQTQPGQAVSGILVPYYLPPNDPYSDTNVQRLLGLMRQYHDVPVSVIVNPSDGPGAAADANYANFIKLLRAAGGKVYGYVATGFALRPPADVTADIEKWRSFYGANPVDGIFLDEQSWDTGPGNSGTAYVDLYKQYTDYCHARGLRTIANPGTNQQPAYFSTYTADVIIVHENSSYPVETDMAGNYVGGHADYSYQRRAALVYGQASLVPASLATLRKYVQLLYVQSDALPNPWDTLPTYLDQLFAGLSEGGATLALQARIDDLEARLAALEARP